MNNELLKKFNQDLQFYWRTKHKMRGGTVTFSPNKKDSDIVILKRVLGNAMKLNPEHKNVESLLKSLEEYLVQNIATEGSARPYLSKDNINLSDDNIIKLCKFNKELAKELKAQVEEEEEQNLGVGAQIKG